MCRLLPCIPFLGVFFLLKSVKKMCMCGGVKNFIVTSKKCIYYCVGGYKRIIALGSPKTHY